MKNTDTAAHRLLLGSARWHYQRHALAAEHVDEEIRLILAGQRDNLRRLHQLQDEQAASWKRLQECLIQIVVRCRRGDADGAELCQYLDTQQQKIARAGSKSAQ